MSAEEARHGLGISMMSLNTERKISHGAAGFGLGLVGGSTQLKNFKKRSVAVQPGKVKEMVEKFNGAAILEETAEVEPLRIRKGPSQEHTPTKNIESDGKTEATITEIDRPKEQDGIAGGINELPSPDEPNNGECHLNARKIRRSLRPKEDDAESVQSLTESDFDEIFAGYNITGSIITEEPEDYSAVSSSAPHKQHKLPSDSIEKNKDISGEERGPNWVPPIYEWFASQCNPPQTFRGKSANNSTTDNPSVTQEATLETNSTSLDRREWIYSTSTTPPIREAEDDDTSGLAREYSKILGPRFIIFDESLVPETEDHSSPASNAFSGLQQPQNLDSLSTSPLLSHSPSEARPSHNYTLSNTSSVYSTEEFPPYQDTDVSSTLAATLDNVQNNFPPLRHHGRHQITEFLPQRPVSPPESSRFSFNPDSDSLTLPSSLSPANEHSVRPPSAISNLSGASTIINSDSTLVDLLPFEDLFTYDAESGKKVVRGGKRLSEQRVAVDGTVWTWDGKQWVARGRSAEASS